MFFSSGSCGKKGKKSEISSEKEETLEPDPLVRGGSASQQPSHWCHHIGDTMPPKEKVSKKEVAKKQKQVTLKSAHSYMQAL